MQFLWYCNLSNGLLQRIYKHTYVTINQMNITVCEWHHSTISKKMQEKLIIEVSFRSLLNSYSKFDDTVTLPLYSSLFLLLNIASCPYLPFLGLYCKHYISISSDTGWQACLKLSVTRAIKLLHDTGEKIALSLMLLWPYNFRPRSFDDSIFPIPNISSPFNWF